MAPLIAPQLTLEIRPIDAMWFLLLQLLSLAHWVSRAIYAVGLTYALTVRFPEPPGGLTAVYEEDGMIVWAGFPGALAVVLYPCPVQGGGGSRANEERSALNYPARQVDALLLVHHSAIVPVFGIAYGAQHVLSLVSLYSKNNYGRWIRRHGGTRNPILLIRMYIDIASALLHLHTRAPPIIHGAVYTRNITVHDNGRARLVLAAIKWDSGYSEDTIGRHEYRFIAPEHSPAPPSGHPRAIPLSTASDCYTFAMTMLEMATGQPPYSSIPSELGVMRAIEQGRQPDRPQTLIGPEPSAASDALWTLFGNMWAQRPEDRPGLDAVHNRLQGIHDMLLVA